MGNIYDAAKAGDKEKIRALTQATRLRKDSTMPTIIELAQAIIGEWGGPHKFARSFYNEFAHASPGSMMRARLMDAVIYLLRSHADITGIRNDLGMLSEDDLMAAARSILPAPVDNGQQIETTQTGQRLNPPGNEAGVSS